MTTKPKAKPITKRKPKVITDTAVAVVDAKPEVIKLTAKQERFCQLYVSQEFFANATQSYIEAYHINLSKAGAYNSARSGGYENLTKPDILARINELLDMSGLNDEFVDKQLLFLITQNADLSSKNKAIAEYNKLKKRVSPLPDDPTLNVLAIQYIAYPKELPDSAYSKYMED